MTRWFLLGGVSLVFVSRSWGSVRGLLVSLTVGGGTRREWRDRSGGEVSRLARRSRDGAGSLTPRSSVDGDDHCFSPRHRSCLGFGPGVSHGCQRRRSLCQVGEERA